MKGNEQCIVCSCMYLLATYCFNIPCVVYHKCTVQASATFQVSNGTILHSNLRHNQYIVTLRTSVFN